MKLNQQLSLSLSLATCLVTNSLQINSVSAQQITSDETTGTTVTSDGNNFTIQNGTRNDGNLFHSFQDFSVPSGGSAFFNNGNDISNILSRVTGGNISNIDGLIRANGSANLFLINPAGIIFGEGASLAIGGSFYGSTADSILFGDGEFSAVNNLDAPILTINAPIGLNFRDNPSDIVTNGSENAIDIADFSLLAVAEDQSINLIGGNINLNNTTLFAPGGNIGLGGLEAAGTVTLNENGGLSFPENIARGNISLDNSQVITNLSNDGEGGSINLNANNIELLNASFLQTGIDADLGFVDAQAGDINIDATGAIDISGGSIFNQVFAGSIGDAGNISIKANSLAFSQVQLSSTTFGEGNAGKILIDVNATAELINSNIFSQVSNTAIGDGGTITVNTTNLSLLDGSQITAGVFGTGNAGSIAVNVDDNTTSQGIGDDGSRSGIFNNVAVGGVGNAGDIEITTANLNLMDGAAITSNLEGQGSAGKITLNVTESFQANSDSFLQSSTFGTGNAGDITLNGETATISLSGASLITSSVSSDAVGTGGNIEITTDILSLSETSRITSDTSGRAGENGRADAGDITLNVTESFQAINSSFLQSDTFGEGDAGNITINGETAAITLDGVNSEPNVFPGIFSSVRNFVNNAGQQLIGSGNSGQIIINADSLSLANGVQIRNSLDSGVVGQGNNINLTANTISLSGASRILSGVASEAVGGGGDIGITVDTLSLSGASAIASDTSGRAGENGRADAGDITLNVTESFQANGGSFLQSDTFGEGDAGNVVINGETATISLFEASNITSNVSQNAIGNAGDITVNVTESFQANDGSFLQSETFGVGNAGNITINGETASITFDGANPENNVSSGIFSSVRSNENLAVIESRNSGQITINADSLSLANGAQINNNLDDGVVGQGNNINLTANTISLSGVSRILSGVAFGATGTGGNIGITADTLSLSGASAIAADTSGRAGENGRADAGDITINVSESFQVTEGSFLQSDTFGEGDAGDITINGETASIIFDGINPETDVSSGISSSVGNFTDPNSGQQFIGKGKGGSVEITTPNLVISNGAGIFAGTFGEGDGGNINLNISDRLELKENSTISVQASETNANAGDITINANNGFVIAFPNEGEGNGSDISASSGSVGGNIFIEAQGVLGIEERDAILGNNTNDIDASGDVEDGSVEIITPTADAIEGANQLPSIPVQPGETVVQACSAQRGIANSNLVIKGKGGIPNSPAAILTSEAISVDSEAETSKSPNQEDVQPISTSKGDIILAQGVEIKEDGGIILTAYKTDNSSRDQKISINCN